MTRPAFIRVLPAALLAVSWLFTLAQAAGPSDSGLSALARVLRRGRWTAADGPYVSRLLRRGESLRTRTPGGVTVLMFAALRGDLALMRSALRGGVEVDARTDDGVTALDHAVRSGRPEAVRLLLDAGADPNAADRLGRTPLMTAVHFRFREGIRLLLARGAAVNHRNRNGGMALAYTDGHPGLTRLLRQHGARP